MWILNTNILYKPPIYRYRVLLIHIWFDTHKADSVYVRIYMLVQCMHTYTFKAQILELYTDLIVIFPSNKKVEEENKLFFFFIVFFCRCATLLRIYVLSSYVIQHTFIKFSIHTVCSVQRICIHDANDYTTMWESKRSHTYNIQWGTQIHNTA